MGGLGISAPVDINAIFWNQAKLPFANKQSAITMNYSPWLADISVKGVSLSSIGGYYKLDQSQVFSASLRYFNLGTIQLTDFSGNLLNTTSPREYSVDLGYAIKINDYFGIGVALRYINSRLVSGDYDGNIYQNGKSVCGDVSLYYNLSEEDDEDQYSIGSTLSNLGGKIGYTADPSQKDFIPANFGLGFGYKKKLSNLDASVSFGLDINKLLVPEVPNATGVYSIDSANLSSYRSTGVMASWLKSFSDGTNQIGDLRFSLGAEFNYNNTFFLRAGYHYEAKSVSTNSFLSFGTGINTDSFEINFSFVAPAGSGTYRNPLSNTLSVGLIFNFDSNN